MPFLVPLMYLRMYFTTQLPLLMRAYSKLVFSVFTFKYIYTCVHCSSKCMPKKPAALLNSRDKKSRPGKMDIQKLTVELPHMHIPHFPPFYIPFSSFNVKMETFSFFCPVFCMYDHPQEKFSLFRSFLFLNRKCMHVQKI